MKPLYFLALLTSLVFNASKVKSQALHDTIFTMSDTLICKITYVNIDNIFYSIKSGNKFSENYIPISKVISYKSGDINSMSSTNKTHISYDSIFIHKYDTTKWNFGIKNYSQYNYHYGMFQNALLVSVYFKNHNIYIGPERLQVFSESLYEDDMVSSKWYKALSFGYLFLPKSNFKNLHYYFGINYSLFQGKYIDYQLGPPYQSSHNQKVVLSTGSIGINYSIIRHLNLSTSFGLTSMSEFFLLTEKSSLNFSLGLEYLIKK